MSNASEQTYDTKTRGERIVTPGAGLPEHEEADYRNRCGRALAAGGSPTRPTYWTTRARNSSSSASGKTWSRVRSETEERIADASGEWPIEARYVHHAEQPSRPGFARRPPRRQRAYTEHACNRDRGQFRVVSKPVDLVFHRLDGLFFHCVHVPQPKVPGLVGLVSRQSSRSKDRN